jgi:hypothetical protein
MIEQDLVLLLEHPRQLGRRDPCLRRCLYDQELQREQPYHRVRIAQSGMESGAGRAMVGPAGAEDAERSMPDTWTTIIGDGSE